MTQFRRITALALCLAMIFCLCACGSTAELGSDIPASSAGKDIEKVVGMDNVFSLNSNSRYSFNPLIATNHSNQLICCLVYENLVEVDNDFNVIPNLITEWTVSDDGKNWEFTIDTTHTFHDGSEVTSNDVRRSIEYAINSDRYSGRFSTIAGVSYGGDKVYVTLSIGNKRFLKLLNIPVIKAGTYADDYPTGSGPYMWNEEHTELVAYEAYPGFEDLPVQTIYIKEYTSAEEIISAYEDSLIDIVVNDPTSLTDLGYSSTNEIRTMSTTNMHFVAFNETSMLGKYSNFRVAMQYAFDRAYLADNLLAGNGTAAAFPMYPTCSDYPTSLAASIDYNLERCLTILNNMGVRDYDEDGKLEFNNGSPQKIELIFIICNDSSAKATMAHKFADDMASIGLKVTVRELAWDDYKEALLEGEFDMFYAEVKLRNDFDITRMIEQRDKDNENTNINFTGAYDLTLLNYLNAYLTAASVDSAYRYSEFCKYLSEMGTIITLGFEKQQIISHRGIIKGIEANIGNPMYNFANWLIDLS